VTAEVWLAIVGLIVSFVVGIIGGVIGAYVGMRIGIAKLETWQQVFQGGLRDVQNDLAVLTDDCHTFDTELELIANKLAMARVRRQRFRD
jgi:uncharacterized protein (DUF697 family)